MKWIDFKIKTPKKDQECLIYDYVSNWILQAKFIDQEFFYKEELWNDRLSATTTVIYWMPIEDAIPKKIMNGTLKFK